MLIVLRGAPGMGKSTYAITHYVPLGYVHLEADMFFNRNGVYTFNPALLGKAHAWCQNECKKALNEGKNVVVSNTFIKLWEMKPYLEMTNDVKVIRMTKMYGNVHNVPYDKVMKMMENMEQYDGEILV